MLVDTYVVIHMCVVTSSDHGKEVGPCLAHVNCYYLYMMESRLVGWGAGDEERGMWDYMEGLQEKTSASGLWWFWNESACVTTCHRTTHQNMPKDQRTQKCEIWVKVSHPVHHSEPTQFLVLITYIVLSDFTTGRGWVMGEGWWVKWQLFLWFPCESIII